MVEWIQALRNDCAGMVINPAAFTYSGYVRLATGVPPCSEAREQAGS
ncbi:MAG TPA: hypothetical protein VD846_02255 [Allosphingosinicella sp.]|nr:hypothetical protein [Allosphingosinicella sp.]